MTKNYRSSDEIVKVSNEVIKLNQNRIPKSCTSEKGKRAKVEIVNAKNPYL